MSWEPVLDQSLYALGWDAISSVADEVGGLSVSSKSLADLCEAALFLTYLHLTQPHRGWNELAIEHIEAAGEKLSSMKSLASALHGGLSGVGWTVAHLTGLLSEDFDPNVGEDQDALTEIDTLLLKRIHSHRLHEYDLINGLVGIGVYFLERLPRPTAHQGLERIIYLIETQSVRAPTGCTWHTPSAHLPENQRHLYPAGYFNLGVAHGIPGIIQFLGETKNAGIEVQKSTDLIGLAVNWLDSQRRSSDNLSFFGTCVAPGQKTRDSRLAWCYGDLGIAAVLYQAWRRSGREDWHSTALSIIDHCLSRPLSETGVLDPGLCHGALGIAHILVRLYQSERSLTYKAAANVWYQRGLAMRDPEIGTGGFFQLLSNRRKADISFLTGAIGGALALCAALSPIEPGWDRILSLSGRECF
jgi:lantibiotic biosynthesis protein